MKTAVIGQFHPDSFAEYISQSLVKLGHESRNIQFGPVPRHGHGRILTRALRFIHSLGHSVQSAREIAMRKFWRDMGATPLDLIVVCHDYLWPSEVRKLKKLTGAMIVLWMPDSIANLGRSYFMNAPYDALFFKDPYIVQSFSELLPIPTYYLPQCCCPMVHRPPEADFQVTDTVRCELTTAGNLHSNRAAVFQQLTDFDVKIWGPSLPAWLDQPSLASMQQKKYVFSSDKARAFHGSKIVINSQYYGEIWGVNKRTFEAAGIGAFQLLDWKPGLSQLFTEGHELISFRGIQDLREKIRYWLPRDEERAEIALNGMRRAHRDHTYDLRISMLLETIAGSTHGYPMPIINASTKLA